MTRRAATGDDILNAAHSALFDAISLITLLREAQEARAETITDPDDLTSPESRQLAVLRLVEEKLQAALSAMGWAL